MFGDGYNGGTTMKPIDRSKNGVGYLGICHADKPYVDCHRCLFCKHVNTFLARHPWVE